MGIERKGLTVVSQIEKGMARTRTTPLEERLLRARHGATLAPNEVLPQVAPPDSELADELLLIEMSLHRAMKRRKQMQNHTASPNKAKILAALKRK